MAKRKALGRGLGAFFPDMDQNEGQKKSGNEETGNNPYIESQEKVNVILNIPVTNIRPNPNQPRKEFDDFKLQELSDSIQMHGLIQPITVRYIGEDRYELVSGERRLRACKMAGMEAVPSFIREVNDENSLAFALIENVQREELNPIEIALGYQRLIDECDYTQEVVAKKVGKNRSTVANMLRLLNLPANIQKALRDAKITTGHARALITIEDSELQQKILQKTIEEDFSVRQIEDEVRKATNRKKKSRRKQLSEKDQHDIELQEISKRLRSKFSTKVQIKKKNVGGEIRIEYYSDEDLDRLIQIFESYS
ncbi:MAG TPA: ParB/RepB/Spo0J family partition protein [Balneolales bacterium]|nr:ParB/RepB/Spo0J family partition protein [Balneolales bacterium]